MRSAAMLLAMLTVGCASGGSRMQGATNDLTSARAEITPLFQDMYAAANAHDTDRHLAVYARTPNIVFVVNDDPTEGWDALRVKQRQWWLDGKSDVVYGLVAPPDYRLLAPDLVLQTYALTSRRSVAGGGTREGRIAVSAIWQKRPEGWRIIYANESTAAKPA